MQTELLCVLLPSVQHPLPKFPSKTAWAVGEAPEAPGVTGWPRGAGPAATTRHGLGGGVLDPREREGWEVTGPGA